MKFNKIRFLFSIISFNLKVYSIPFNKNEIALDDIADISYETAGLEETVYESNTISEYELYDTILVDEDFVAEITEDLSDKEIDFDSDSDEEISSSLNVTEECSSEECIEISKKILNSLDTSVNPCDDFYEFSCGGWVNKVAKNEGFGYNTNAIVEKNVQNNLGEILESDYQINENLSNDDQKYDEIVFNKMKTIYEYCMNEDEMKNNINKESIIKYIQDFNLNELLNNHEETEALTNLLVKLHNDGITFLFYVLSEKDSEDDSIFNPAIYFYTSNRYIADSFAEIELSKLGLSVYQFNNEDDYNLNIQQKYEDINNYKKYIGNVLKYIYGQDEDKIETMIESIIEVESKIAQSTIKMIADWSYPVSFENVSDVTDYEHDYEFMTDPIDSYDSYEYDTYYNYNDYYDDNETSSVDGLTIYNPFNNYEDDGNYYFVDDGESYVIEDDEGYNNYGDDTDQYIIETTNITNLNEDCPLINWELYFKKRFEYYGLENTIKEDSLIYEINLKDTYEIIKDINIKDMAYYIEWVIIDTLTDFVSDLSKMKKEFKITVNEYNEYEEYDVNEDINNKSESCIESVKKIMPLALSKYYTERYFEENKKSEMKEMTENIKNAMLKRIPEIEWLDDTTKEYAIEKLLKMKFIIGNSDYFMDPKTLNTTYKKIDASNHIKNIMMIQEGSNLIIENYFEKISNERIPSYIFNPNYEKNKNIVNLMTASFEKPLYESNQLSYLNYGKIGYSIGHELTHAYDNIGRLYDADGKKNNWWTDSDNDEFMEYSQCYVNQYNKFLFKDYYGKIHRVNGTLSLSENIADNGGLERAYEGWKLSIEKNPEKAKEHNLVLPNLSEYSLDQLFYISFAQSYCAKGSPYVPNDSHSPEKFRVNGAISNSEHFAQVFNCPINSTMNPKNKCSLW